MLNTKETDDTKLIPDILIGNQAAQEILYNKYRKIIFDFIKGKYYLNNDMEDCVSEILIKMFLNIKSYDESKSKFKSWVLTIANNYMIDKWRNNTVSFNNENITISNVEWNDQNNSIINPIDYNLDYHLNNYHTTISMDFDDYKTINYVSRQLSPIDYTLLDMKYVQGYNYTEIGKEFNLTSSTVSNKINYIKTKLKKNIIK